MSQSIKRYQQELGQQAAGLFPTWLPGDRIDPGDVGTLVGGRFRRSTSLAELGITFELDELGSPHSLRYSSTKETKIDFGGGTSLEDPSASIASGSARVDIQFGTEGAFLFHADGVRQLRVKNRGNVEKRIIELTRRNRWRSEWYMVEEVYLADCATIIVSQGESTSLSLSIKGNVELGSVSLSDPSLNISVLVSSGLIFQVICSRAVRPLYACSKIAGGWFRSRYLSAVRGEGSEEENGLERAPIDDLVNSWQEV